MPAQVDDVDKTHTRKAREDKCIPNYFISAFGFCQLSQIFQIDEFGIRINGFDRNVRSRTGEYDAFTFSIFENALELEEVGGCRVPFELTILKVIRKFHTKVFAQMLEGEIFGCLRTYEGLNLLDCVFVQSFGCSTLLFGYLVRKLEKRDSSSFHGNSANHAGQDLRFALSAYLFSCSTTHFVLRAFTCKQDARRFLFLFLPIVDI